MDLEIARSSQAVTLSLLTHERATAVSRKIPRTTGATAAYSVLYSMPANAAPTTDAPIRGAALRHES